ncbi:Permease family protein [Bifidobacterium bohemicum]|uniref:Xanthine/uracil/vitamin C permease n=1 Tax=Bifidobacterium bohemicum DSM 22767 TaxID=1437606 RepID=A0A086ZJV0_9BIFI|nr:xanthine/uracil/vitamin C permease [Bifidobacterium bohemicum DSM 22767]SCB81748.1 Permease family protein [Bifidobacterium bohemicum]
MSTDKQPTGNASASDKPTTSTAEHQPAEQSRQAQSHSGFGFRFGRSEATQDYSSAIHAFQSPQSARSNRITAEALTSLDGRISFWHGIPFGLQHVMAMFVANLAPIFLVTAAAHLSPEQSAMVIQNGLLVAGLGTCLQLYPLWRIGSRLPMVTGISFTYVAAAVAIVGKQGYGALVGAVIVGGLIELILGLTATFWKKYVPPIVSAIVVTSIGFSLLSTGASSFGGGAGAKDFGSWQNLTLGLISLVACLAFQLLMRGTAKQLSVLFGLVVGYVAALCMGKVDFSEFSNLQAFSLPKFMPFAPTFDAGAIVSFALLYVVSSVEVLGDTAALSKVGLNRLPSDRETSGAIAGDGLISTISGLFGCLPLTSFAQNIGLVAVTKVVNRKVIFSGGLILILASFVPGVAQVFNSMPQSVLGGCTIMMFGNIILSGFQMIAEAGFSQRNTTIAALALTIGIGFTQVGGIFANFPALFQSIFATNCIAVSFVVAVILNALLPGEERFLVNPNDDRTAE